MAHMATPLVLINVLATLGGLAGGYLPAWMVNRGIAVNKARKFTLLLCAICVLPILLVSNVSNLWGL